MKKLIVAIIIIAFIILGAPYVTGKVAETQINNVVSQLNQNSQQNGNTQILTYERGLYSSKSTYRYKLPLQFSALLTSTNEIEVQCAIEHGVISIDYQCDFANNQGYADFISANFNGDDPFSIFGEVNALGNLNSTILIDEIIDFKLSDDDLLNLAKTELSVTTDKNLTSFDISGGTESLNLVTGTESMLVEDIFVDGDLNPLEGGLVTGDFSFAIAKIDLKNLESTVNIEGFKSYALAQLNDNNIDSKTEITINAMTLANASFETAEGLSFTGIVNGINKDALIEYQAYSKKLQTQLLNQELTAAEVNPMEMVPIIERMLAEGFNMSFDLSGELDNNANSFAANLELLDSITMSDAMALAYAPQETLNKLNILINSNFNKETVNADPKLAASVVDSPLFVESGDHYQMNIKLGSQIELNGQASDINQLMSLMSATAMQQQALQSEPEVEAK